MIAVSAAGGSGVGESVAASSASGAQGIAPDPPLAVRGAPPAIAFPHGVESARNAWAPLFASMLTAAASQPRSALAGTTHSSETEKSDDDEPATPVQDSAVTARASGNAGAAGQRSGLTNLDASKIQSWPSTGGARETVSPATNALRTDSRKALVNGPQ